jgi:nucleoside-diphosphate-sugar epimerase
MSPPESVAGRRVAVTGGAGRLGRRLVAGLVRAGAESVTVLTHRQPMWWPADLDADRVRCVTGSVLNLGTLCRAFEGCSVVFHLAGRTRADESTGAAVAYLRVNGMGTAKVAVACRRQQVDALIYASTSHVYGIPQTLPVPEDHPLVPMSPYAASKVAGEAALHGYGVVSGVPTTIARLSNLYGANVGDDTVLGRALEQVVAGQPIRLRNLTAVRDFLFVDDAVEALLRLVPQSPAPLPVRVVNVGPGTGTSVLEAAELLADIAREYGFGAAAVEPSHLRPVERVSELVLDTTRLRQLLGWAPETSLRTGLSRWLHQRLHTTLDDRRVA